MKLKDGNNYIDNWNEKQKMVLMWLFLAQKGNRDLLKSFSLPKEETRKTNKKKKKSEEDLKQEIINILTYWFIRYAKNNISVTPSKFRQNKD